LLYRVTHWMIKKSKKYSAKSYLLERSLLISSDIRTDSYSDTFKYLHPTCPFRPNPRNSRKICISTWKIRDISLTNISEFNRWKWIGGCIKIRVHSIFRLKDSRKLRNPIFNISSETLRTNLRS